MNHPTLSEILEWFGALGDELQATRRQAFDVMMADYDITPFDAVRHNTLRIDWCEAAASEQLANDLSRRFIARFYPDAPKVVMAEVEVVAEAVAPETVTA